MKSATAADLGLKETDSLYFNYDTMNISGCKCNSCWDWKTRPENRNFWIARERQPGRVN